MAQESRCAPYPYSLSLSLALTQTPQPSRIRHWNRLEANALATIDKISANGSHSYGFLLTFSWCIIHRSLVCSIYLWRCWEWITFEFIRAISSCKFRILPINWSIIVCHRDSIQFNSHLIDHFISLDQYGDHFHLIDARARWSLRKS